MRKRDADAEARAQAIQRDLDEARANQAADRMAARAVQAAFENAEHARVIQETQEVIRAAAEVVRSFLQPSYLQRHMHGKESAHHKSV